MTNIIDFKDELIPIILDLIEAEEVNNNDSRQVAVDKINDFKDLIYLHKQLIISHPVEVYCVLTNIDISRYHAEKLIQKRFKNSNYGSETNNTQ
jgi:hypothetical protein